MFVTPGSRATRRRTIPGGNVQPPLSLNFGTITTNPAEPAPGMALSIYGTWNAGGVQFDAPLFINVTNTASAAASFLVDCQVNSSSVLTISKLGDILMSGGLSVGTGSTYAQAFPGTGQFSCGGSVFLLCNAAFTSYQFSFGLTSNIALARSIGTWGWSNSATAATTIDVGLYRPGATGTVAVINGTATNASAFQVYNTTDSTSSPTNYERGAFDWTTTTNVLTIGTQKGGTGSSRNFQLISGGTVIIDWGVTASGLLSFCAGNPGNQLFKFYTDANVRVSIVNNTPWNGGVIVCAQGGFGISANNTLSVSALDNPDTGLDRTAAGVWNFNTGIAHNHDGWFQWGGQVRNTSNFTSSGTTLTAITGLSSVGLQANRNYKFEAWLAVTGSSAGGVLVGITSASTTITTLASDGFLLDGSTVRGGQGVISSTGTAVVSVSSATVTSSNPSIRISGMIRVASSGTFGLTLAQSTANNSPQTIVSSGSWLEVFDVP